MSAVADLDPRQDMALIRERLSLQLTRGEDVGPTLVDLAARNSLALADLVVGPRAQHDPALVEAALHVIDTLEEAVAPNGLYRRLVALSKPTQMAVLQCAAQRHPAASWMVDLSRTVEGPAAGTTHLRSAAGHPSFTAACWAHAKAGHHAGLTAIAEELGRPEPAGALAAVGAVEAAALATVRTLETTTESPVVATLAAVWGPDVRPILKKTIGHLRSRRVALALHAQLKGYPDIAALLDTVIRAMANR